MAFYTGDAFPEDYWRDAFVAMRGSWNRQPPSGYEVVRIDFEDGQPVGFEPFITGFLMEDEESPSGWGHMGRLAGRRRVRTGRSIFPTVPMTSSTATPTRERKKQTPVLWSRRTRRGPTLACPAETARRLRPTARAASPPKSCRLKGRST